VENLEFVHTLEKILGREAKIVDAPCPASEPLVTFADITKARSLLDYEPKVNVALGLERFIRWAQDERVMND
jgi:UDP-glucuronate 4-epimerase